MSWPEGIQKKFLDAWIPKWPKLPNDQMVFIISKGMSWCLNTKMTEVTKWLNGFFLPDIVKYSILNVNDQVTRKKPNYSNDPLKNENISSPIEPYLLIGD